MTKNKQPKINNESLDLEAMMLNSGKLLQRLWKTTLASKLHKRDKAEILRLLIFAFTIIAIIVLLVFNHP